MPGANLVEGGIMSIIKNIKDTSIGLANEFKAFIAKGNVMDLAVGVIIGGAFGSIVSSMVKDVITPLIGMIGGKPDFSNIAIGAHKATVGGKEVLTGGIMIGNFMNEVVSFLIMAGVVFFLLVKPMNKLMAAVKKPAPAAAPPTPEDVLLLREIRDLLKEKPAVQ
jgi:large conductance mechanosensitive channel